MKAIIVIGVFIFVAVCIVIAFINSEESDDYMQALEDEEQARYLNEWAKKRRARHGHK